MSFPIPLLTEPRDIRLIPHTDRLQLLHICSSTAMLHQNQNMWYTANNKKITYSQLYPATQTNHGYQTNILCHTLTTVAIYMYISMKIRHLIYSYLRKTARIDNETENEKMNLDGVQIERTIIWWLTFSMQANGMFWYPQKYASAGIGDTHFSEYVNINVDRTML